MFALAELAPGGRAEVERAGVVGVGLQVLFGGVQPAAKSYFRLGLLAKPDIKGSHEERRLVILRTHGAGLLEQLGRLLQLSQRQTGARVEVIRLEEVRV